MSADKSEDKASAPDAGGGEKTIPAGEPKGGKKKLALLAAGAVVLLGGGGFGAWEAHLLPFSGGGKAEAGKEEAGKGAASSRVLLPVPPATANLDNGAGRTVYVKMTASVEVEGARSLTSLQGRLAEVEDIFQTYLHESRPQDLHGSGFYRLREALLRRLRVAFAPLDVTNLYITELLTQ